MSSFKAQSALLGLPVDGDSDDDDDEEDEQLRNATDDDEDEGEEEAEESDEDAEAGAGGAGTTSAGDRRGSKKGERAWLEANFIELITNDSGATIYKSKLLPDKVFFSKDKLQEFIGGKRYKRLIHEMRKGMRTHGENEKLRLKAEARRERGQIRKKQRLREKREKAVADADEADIERRKAAFAAKKARRLARKASAS